MKIHFFATSSVLAFLFLSGCDGSGGEVASGDAGVVAKTTDVGTPAGAPHCVIPAPKVPRQGLSTTPSGGYQWLANYPSGFTCAPYGVQPGGGPWPTDCSDPVDGFSNDTSTWCCVLTTHTSDPKYVYALSPSLQCPGWNMPPNPPAGYGVNDNNADVALCSTSGQFVGWKCSQEY